MVYNSVSERYFLKDKNYKKHGYAGLTLIMWFLFCEAQFIDGGGEGSSCGDSGTGSPEHPLPTPSNVSIVLTSWKPPAVRVQWHFPTDKTPFLHVIGFQLTYRPLNARYRVVHDLPPEQRSLTLKPLLPGVEYQVHLVAVSVEGLSRNSSTVRFLSPDVQNGSWSGDGSGEYSLLEEETAIPPVHYTVREEEIVIVVLVLAVWVFVIVLFFNKWGKIRMLEPYQPQYHSHPAIAKPAGIPISDTLGPLERFNVEFGSMPANYFSKSRPRQNSVFVGSPYRSRSGSVLSEPRMPRKVKSAEDIKSLVVQVGCRQLQSTAL